MEKKPILARKWGKIQRCPLFYQFSSFPLVLYDVFALKLKHPRVLFPFKGWKIAAQLLPCFLLPPFLQLQKMKRGWLSFSRGGQLAPYLKREEEGGRQRKLYKIIPPDRVLWLPSPPFNSITATTFSPAFPSSPLVHHRSLFTLLQFLPRPGRSRFSFKRNPNCPLSSLLLWEWPCF